MKKKIFIAIAAFCLVMVSAAVGAYAATQMRITVNEKPTSITPTLIGDKAYLPLRDVADLLGIDINYEDATRTIHLSTTNKNAMPDPPQAAGSSTSNSNSAPSQEEILAANTLFGIIGGVEDTVNAARNKSYDADQIKRSLDHAKQYILAPVNVLSKSNIEQARAYGKSADLIVKTFDEAVSSGNVADNQQLKKGLSDHWSIHLQFLKLIRENSDNAAVSNTSTSKNTDLKNHLAEVKKYLIEMHSVMSDYYNNKYDGWKAEDEMIRITNAVYDDMEYLQLLNDKPTDVDQFYYAAQRTFAAFKKALSFYKNNEDRDAALQRLSESFEIYDNISVLRN